MHVTKPYLNTFHFMTKVMADVEYPIFKKDLIAQVGNSEILWIGMKQ